MYRYLTKQNAVMAGSYLLFFFLRSFSYFFFVSASTETIAVIIKAVTVAEYLVVAFIGAYGVVTTRTLRGGMVIVLGVKLFSELISIFRLVIRLAGRPADLMPFALGRVATVAGISLLAALLANSIMKARDNREE